MGTINTCGRKQVWVKECDDVCDDCVSIRLDRIRKALLDIAKAIEKKKK